MFALWHGMCVGVTLVLSLVAREVVLERVPSRFFVFQVRPLQGGLLRCLAQSGGGGGIYAWHDGMIGLVYFAIAKEV